MTNFNRHLFMLTLLLSLSGLGGLDTGGTSLHAANPTRYIVYGDGFAERMLDSGYMEARLQQQTGGIQLRSLALNGDQVHHRSRPTRFENHLRVILKHWQADEVLIFNGKNEALNQDMSPADFESALTGYLNLIKTRHPKANLTFVSPIAFEKLDNPELPDAEAINSRVSTFNAVIEKVCQQEKVKFINIFEESKKLLSVSSDLTVNGLYLTDEGNQLFGDLIAGKITGKNADAGLHTKAWYKNLIALSKRKEVSARDAYHPTNSVHYYGVRARSYEYDTEIYHHMELAKLLDKQIWAQAKSTDVKPLTKLPTKQSTPPNKAPRKGLGKLLTAKDDIKNFKVADGFEVNLFAGSEKFPELVNPLQMAVGPKGRLWVATFGTYPVPVPGREPKDKILIFEDTDNDGEADKVTTFADNLLLPDGFAFYGDGIVVSVPWKFVWLRDTDGDDKADKEVELLRGLDNTDSHHAGFLNWDTRGKLMFKDGVFHRAQLETPRGVVYAKNATLFSFDMNSHELKVENQPAAPNPWKIAHNQWGEPIHMFGGGQIHDISFHDIYTPPGVSLKGLGMPFRDDKGCTLELVSGVNFPSEWQNGLLTGHLLSQNYVLYTPIKLKDGTYRKSGDSIKLLESSNKSFRPVDLVHSLDGSLMVSDFYYPIIGHAQHGIRNENRDYTHGRIWRVSKKGGKLAKAPKIVGASIDELLNLLGDPLVRVRELARMELDKHDDAKVVAAVKTKVNSLIGKSDEASGMMLLECLWLYERYRSFENADLIQKLVSSKNDMVRSMAVRSLRHWTGSLGSEKVEKLLTAALKDKAARVELQAVSTLSHLQKDQPWAKSLLQIHQSGHKTIQSMVSETAKIDNPGIRPEFPILDPAKEGEVKIWTLDTAPNSFVSYLESTEEGREVKLFASNKIGRVVFNETIIYAASTNFANVTSLSLKLKKGVNKLVVSSPPAKKKKKKGKKGKPAATSKKSAKPAKPSLRFYLTDMIGAALPGSILKLPSDASGLQALAQRYDREQEDGWLEFAQHRYTTQCSACHSLDGTRRVGPSFKGLLHRKQTVLDLKGRKKEVTVTREYLRNAITNPTSEYPESYQPIMPKLPLTPREVDFLVRYLESVK